MTNYEAIVGSDVDTLAEFLNDTVDCATCPAVNICDEYDECVDAFKVWLKQETGEHQLDIDNRLKGVN